MQISQIFSQAGTDRIEISKSQNANNEGVALPKQNVTDDVGMRIFQRITINPMHVAHAKNRSGALKC